MDTTPNRVILKIKGSCVDDLFHILENNNYPVQVSTTDKPEEYFVEITLSKYKRGYEHVSDYESEVKNEI